MFVFDSFEIKGNHICKLVLPEKVYSQDLFQIIQDEHDRIQEWLPIPEKTKTLEDEENFIEYVQKKMIEKKLFTLCILVDNRVVGTIDLHDISHKHRRAEIGYWISGRWEGYGIVTKACKSIINYGFSVLDLHKIYIEVDSQNFKSQAVAQRLGFSKEAHFKKVLVHNGDYHDSIWFGLVNENN
ncbi:GNAT family N-acetyltransferase [Floricoccus penangensis]|uniref:GNAT family N-acetyltransferase n=1 Tax=Floricoccus penangensis TaxID=1859475 RepID=UPI00203C6758|nr:GNAT family protein [Floricoccus penangensis]URZ87825.1 GNAT family N-acetyltransferase [Floricoccus penangensis]